MHCAIHHTLVKLTLLHSDGGKGGGGGIEFKHLQMFKNITNFNLIQSTGSVLHLDSAAYMCTLVG